jgi:hypothetical protein
VYIAGGRGEVGRAWLYSERSIAFHRPRCFIVLCEGTSLSSIQNKHLSKVSVFAIWQFRYFEFSEFDFFNHTGRFDLAIEKLGGF